MICLFLLVLLSSALGQLPNSTHHDTQYVKLQCSNPLPYAFVKPGFCAFIWASGLSVPRGIWAASNGDVLVLERGLNQISVLYNQNGNVQKTRLAGASGINHAVMIGAGYVYAASLTTVYRWAYTPGDRRDLGAGQVVVNSVPNGGHQTRSLEFRSGLLYVQVGSNVNVDSTSVRSRIKSFSVTSIPAGGHNWNSAGQIFADGLRNEVGLRFDSSNRLWGVENGMDNLNRGDIGGDVHDDNPSEELNMFPSPGLFYGYPFCWTQFKLRQNFSNPIGTQWGLPQFMNDGVHTDAWCRNANNVVPPMFNFQAHMAPLDLLFYYGTTFPIPSGDLFVAFHGSWNRNPPVGYKVSHVEFSNGRPVKEEIFLSYIGPGETGSNWRHRPVGLALTQCGGSTECLLITSDASNVIIAVVADV